MFRNVLLSLTSVQIFPLKFWILTMHGFKTSIWEVDAEGEGGICPLLDLPPQKQWWLHIVDGEGQENCWALNIHGTVFPRSFFTTVSVFSLLSSFNLRTLREAPQFQVHPLVQWSAHGLWAQSPPPIWRVLILIHSLPHYCHCLHSVFIILAQSLSGLYLSLLHLAVPSFLLYKLRILCSTFKKIYWAPTIFYAHRIWQQSKEQHPCPPRADILVWLRRRG
jgi:hypothetical protein